ncbi:MAG: MobC family plasmid mobilization relaxosome protein [Oscillospiraceae bacterium]|nr:MobC family plasmid mobilization relaxosome protein [Oscillospiraceae bacterium]
MDKADRFRKKRINIYLLDEEFDILTDKAKMYKITKSDYLRSCIVLGGILGDNRKNYTDEQVAVLRSELTKIGNNINQITYRLNTMVNAQGLGLDFEMVVRDIDESFRTLLRWYCEHIYE